MIIHEINETCYEVTQPDGGGYKSEHIAYFSTKEVADQYADKHRAVWPKYVNQVTLTFRCVICETIGDKELYDLDCIKQNALSKLTDKEKAALGLT